ncbi:MAG TPA: tRNA (adenosine(37)-N6)-threonylcarbamoyltransferase complex dimerization subunit type 1 TsaB [Anaerolineales bacterium]|nr:tRNA (adenosine(37)-N6)-threonylcarbamoyltransferase complex dimerization subunit type 1 TsaB [Anaerolineales bacterium]HMV97162.1 tRNA (adenosine(37)-N6)-threonylcarbamoyltransferase complex dimerization subunit type 1 TsaB [Anaerolineales bacterium]HMX20672.1 tRNA (adenosine(37)-N6)-threonylcarbamoyltransferase complex dimerization subunit type 1 TsaB [Anaerolineales bacterium]HMX75838.1 tRNA (adenosine(37)-N6)-threonylcarbamoyltransferase complex dimerization subunit type 1 TsaB [Anaerolin
MLIAVDTSTAQVGLALYDGNQVLGELTWTTRQHHTTELAPALTGLLSRSGVSMDMVSALGVAIGPGSFTSLRVGLALVKGLALARRLPVIGISTLDVIAAAQPASKHPLLAVIQAGRKRIAFSEYKSLKNEWQVQGPVRSGTVDELADSIESPTVVAGEFSPDDRSRLSKKRAKILLASPAYCVRRPSLLAELAWERWQKNEVDDAASLAPIYLHVEGTPIPS